MIVLAVGPAATSQAAPNFEKDVLPYFRSHCFECHNATTQEGEFRIDNLSHDVGVKDTARWAEIRERISSGEMPPEDVADRPTAESSEEVIEWLAARIDEGEAARMAKRDRVVFYRLSRDEYVHTVYDLLGVHYDAADPGGFTDDPEWHGFERLGSVLSLSASHVEKYFTAAETILDEAYPDQETEIEDRAQTGSTADDDPRTTSQSFGGGQFIGQGAI